MMGVDRSELLKSIKGVAGLAAMLGRVRRDRELSVEQLAARTRLSEQYLAGLEAGKSSDPGLARTVALARGCEVSVSLLVSSFALPRDDPLPWPREHCPPAGGQDGPVPGLLALGSTVREWRLERDWSQGELAMLLRTHNSYLSLLERGLLTDLRLFTVVRLGRMFAAESFAQVARATRLAQSYAGEIDAPPLRRLKRDRLRPEEPPSARRPPGERDQSF